MRGRYKLYATRMDLGLNTVAHLRIDVWNGRGLTPKERQYIYGLLAGTVEKEMKRVAREARAPRPARPTRRAAPA